MAGKAVSLIKLAQHGIVVPTGFHIDESHYHEAISPVRNALLAEARNAEAVRRIFENIGLPARTVRALNDGVKQIPSGSNLVVRSSGNIVVNGRKFAEDSNEVSLAGQFESFLNVPRRQLETAVRQCWASLFNERSMETFGIDRNYIENSSMTVLVQELVPAVASAVVMTVDPLSSGTLGGIELSIGPCEAIVSGIVSPDEVLFNRSSGMVVDRKIGRKELVVEYKLFSRGLGNAIKKPLPEILRKQMSVAEGVLTAIIEVALKIERIFGVPQDIELVIGANEKITVVQARPITRLPDKFVPLGGSILQTTYQQQGEPSCLTH